MINELTQLFNKFIVEKYNKSFEDYVLDTATDNIKKELFIFLDKYKLCIITNKIDK